MKRITAVLTACCLVLGANLAAQPPAGRAAASDLLAPQATADFYADDASALVWQDNSHYDQLLLALEALADHGLNPTHYHLQELNALRDAPRQRDRYATDAWFSAAAHMLYGKLNPTTVEPDWTAASREADLAASLRQALADGDIVASLARFAPRQPQYQTLLDEYRQLRQQSEEPVDAVPAGPVLRSGMIGDRVSALQRRLEQLGVLGPAYQQGLVDVVTDEAVRIFQAMNDLDADGLVGPATLSALNLGPREKLDKLRVNLERWRWLPDDLGQRHVQVNIAGFNVTTWESGVPVRTHLAIVGRTYRKTPVFSDQIEYLVFNPWWEVPPSIAKVDKLPLFRQQPQLVRELGFQVLDRSGQVLDTDSIDWNRVTPGSFSYRLRQEPGENNALGQVKIMFPNAHNVYLHDTPTRGLFEQRQRAFSSGCVRTQFPLELAAWLLQETPGWDRQRIETTVNSGRETRVNLASRVPVHILYFTALSELYGGIRYLDDIYQRDAAVLAGLRAAHD